jgi:SH3-like domain-containing protein
LSFFMRFIITSLLFLFIFTLPVLGAPPKPRPYSGSGLLLIRTTPLHHPETAPRLILYREPGIGRIAEMTAADLPLLVQVLGTTDGENPVAVMATKGAWLKIAYDEAGRQGWIEMEVSWQYTPWEEFLPGRVVRLLPGLKKGAGALRSEPSSSAVELATLSPAGDGRAELIRGDWLRIRIDPQTSGWLRWRDESGRFLAIFPGENGQQKN